ncbi:uncharacterized protein LOC143807726 isoform X1 [Ranitomeya variabilis]|uniref:uncharacterized protein LOC143807726 isoform X1 n=1 Tax=Ranitomeya variabilis TaxID=490064 RepID=UPI0040564C56
MSLPTATYNDTEANAIISRVASSSHFLQIPTGDLKTRDYEQASKRFISLDLHNATLAEYYKVQRIPRGLRSHLRPALFLDQPDYCNKFDAILNKCSMDLILLTLEFLHTAVTEAKQKVEIIEQQLVNTSTLEDWQTIKSKVDKNLAEFKTKLESKKRRKFFKDSEDYISGQVYRWQSTEFYRPTRQPRSYYSSSGSDESLSLQNPFFRFQRKSNTRKSRRRGDRRYQRSKDADQVTGHRNFTPYSTPSSCDHTDVLDKDQICEQPWSEDDDVWEGQLVSQEVDDDETLFSTSQEDYSVKVLDDEVTDPTWEGAMQSEASSAEREGFATLQQARRDNGVARGRRREIIPQNIHTRTRTRVRSSLVWRFFKESAEDKRMVICNLCHTKISRGLTSTSLTTTSMLRHISAKHPARWAERLGPQLVSAGDTTATASSPVLRA